MREVYTYLMSQYLPTRYPSMFNARRDLNRFQNLVTGRAFPLSCPEDPREALAILGETVEDDMFLVQNTEHGHRSVAFVCCHPSGFDPSQKLGKGLREIHGPVPHYDKIGPSMERFFGRLEVGKNVKRMNVSCDLFALTITSLLILAVVRRRHAGAVQSVQEPCPRRRRRQRRR